MNLNTATLQECLRQIRLFNPYGNFKELLEWIGASIQCEQYELVYDFPKHTKFVDSFYAYLSPCKTETKNENICKVWILEEIINNFKKNFPQTIGALIEATNLMRVAFDVPLNIDSNLTLNSSIRKYTNEIVADYNRTMRLANKTKINRIAVSKKNLITIGIGIFVSVIAISFAINSKTKGK